MKKISDKWDIIRKIRREATLARAKKVILPLIACDILIIIFLAI